MGGLAIVFGLLGVAWLAILVMALAAILTAPAATWEEPQPNQWMWLAVVILMPLVGVVLYLFVAKPRLDAATPAAGSAIR